MTLNRSTYWLILLAVCWSCAGREEYIHLHGEVQGTTYSIKYRNPDKAAIPDQVDSVFRNMDENFSTYVSSSVISSFNNHPRGVRIPDQFRELWEQCWEININTDGLFDPTLYPVLSLYGFDAGKAKELDSTKILEALSYTGMQLVELKGDSMIKKMAEVKLNLNAIAQGFTVDCLSQLLDSYNIADYMIEVGGELRVKGKNLAGELWSIGLDRPIVSDQRELLCTVSLDNRAMATSGNYRKFVEINGKSIGHILNPKTGFPTPTNLLSATVFSTNCAKADAYATAFMCMDQLDITEIVSRDMDLDVILVSLNETDTTVYISPGIAASVKY